jgi:hypothetical protein
VIYDSTLRLWDVLSELIPLIVIGIDHRVEGAVPSLLLDLIDRSPKLRIPKPKVSLSEEGRDMSHLTNNLSNLTTVSNSRGVMHPTHTSLEIFLHCVAILSIERLSDTERGRIGIKACTYLSSPTCSMPGLLFQCKLLEASSIVIDLEGFQPWLAFDIKAGLLLAIVSTEGAVGSNIFYFTAMEPTTLSHISLGDVRETRP